MIATWASVTASAITALATIALAWVGMATARQNRRLIEAAQTQATANQRLADETAEIIRQNRELIEATLREAKAVEEQASAATEMAKQNSTLIEATRRQAEAVEEQAKASQQQAEAAMKLLEETQRDRELAYQPHLVIERTKETVSSWNSAYTVSNIGKGPALHCRFANHEFFGVPETHELWSSGLFDLGAGDSRSIRRDANSRWHDNVLDGLPVGGTLTVDACCCEDLFGNKLQFATGFEMPDPHPKLWRHDAPHPAPKWTEWYMPLRSSQ